MRVSDCKMSPRQTLNDLCSPWIQECILVYLRPLPKILASLVVCSMDFRSNPKRSHASFDALRTSSRWRKRFHTAPGHSASDLRLVYDKCSVPAGVAKKYTNATNFMRQEVSRRQETNTCDERGRKSLLANHSRNSRMTTSDSSPCSNPRNRPLHSLYLLFDLQRWGSHKSRFLVPLNTHPSPVTL